MSGATFISDDLVYFVSCVWFLQECCQVVRMMSLSIRDRLPGDLLLKIEDEERSSNCVLLFRPQTPIEKHHKVIYHQFILSSYLIIFIVRYKVDNVKSLNV